MTPLPQPIHFNHALNFQRIVAEAHLEVLAIHKAKIHSEASVESLFDFIFDWLTLPFLANLVSELRILFFYVEFQRHLFGDDAVGEGANIRRDLRINFHVELLGQFSEVCLEQIGTTQLSLQIKSAIGNKEVVLEEFYLTKLSLNII